MLQYVSDGRAFTFPLILGMLSTCFRNVVYMFSCFHVFFLFFFSFSEEKWSNHLFVTSCTLVLLLDYYGFILN